MTLAQLSEITGLSPAIVSQIERGLANPSFTTLAQLAHGLDIPVGKFFIGQPDTTSPVVRKHERRNLVGVTKKSMGEAVYELLTPRAQRRCPGGAMDRDAARARHQRDPVPSQRRRIRHHPCRPQGHLSGRGMPFPGGRRLDHLLLGHPALVQEQLRRDMRSDLGQRTTRVVSPASTAAVSDTHRNANASPRRQATRSPSSRTFTPVREQLRRGMRSELGRRTTPW